MTTRNRKPTSYGAICHAGGRRIEITAPHAEWLDWALTALYQQAANEAKAQFLLVPRQEAAS